jgi:predicted O-linked N-acetylglucosamine transferase (SPINDLY family)
MVGFLEAIDRARHDVYVYSTSWQSADDLVTSRAKRALRSADRWISCSATDNADIAASVNENMIDVLVDVFYIKYRMEILAARPAPVQLNFIGHPSTCGAHYIQYISVDRITAPPDHASHFSERLAVMPWNYMVNSLASLFQRSRTVLEARSAERAHLRQAHGLPAAKFVLVSLNSAFKQDPLVFALWMRVLVRVPHAVLWVIVDAESEARLSMEREAQRAGVGTDRLLWAPSRQLDAHLQRLAAGDLCVDTFAYNAHATAMDAIWGGLPLVSYAGETMSSRLAHNVLFSAGMQRLIARTPDEYVELIVALANHPERMDELRAELARATDAPLFDTRQYTRHWERSVRMMVEHMYVDQRTSHVVLADRYHDAARTRR